MSVTRTGTSRAAATQGTTGSVTRPAGASLGDLMIVEFGVETATAITPPAGVGFVELIDEQVNGGAFRHGLYWRTDDGTAGPWVFTYGGSNVYRWWRAVSYSGHDPADPIADFGSQQSGGSSASVVAPSIDPAVADCLLAYFGNPDGPTTSTWTPPAGMAAVDNVANAVFLAEQALPASGATGTRTGTISASRPNVGTLVAIAPATPDPVGGPPVGSLNLLGVGR